MLIGPALFNETASAQSSGDEVDQAIAHALAVVLSRPNPPQDEASRLTGVQARAVLEVYLRHFHVQIDRVQHRPGDASQVILDLLPGALEVTRRRGLRGHSAAQSPLSYQRDRKLRTLPGVLESGDCVGLDRAYSRTCREFLKPLRPSSALRPFW